MRLVPNSLHDEVAATLREQIFDGSLAPGSFVDETALCERLSISRTPLREALKVLTAEGLLRHEPRRGCFVNEVTERDLDEIFPVIALLEGRCAYEAARNASDAELQELDALHERLVRHARAKRINDYYATNHIIHEAIIKLADNKWLAQVIGDLRELEDLAQVADQVAGAGDRRPAQDPQARAPAATACARAARPEPVGAPGRVRGAEGARQRRRRRRHAHAPDTPARGAARGRAPAEVQGDVVTILTSIGVPR